MKTIALLLIVVVALDGMGFALETTPASADSQTKTGEARQAAKAKAEVQKRGVGEKSRVRVSLRDGTEVKGYISKIDENSFEVMDRKSGKADVISYTDVSKVKGPELSKPAQVLIVVGVFVGIVGGICLALIPKT